LHKNKPTIFYNEFEHNILALVGNAKKNENQNKSIQNEHLVNFALRNVALNELLLIFFIINVYQLRAFIESKQIINDKSSSIIQRFLK
jgi:hypothetical protein